MGVFDLPTVPDVPTSSGKGGIFTLPGAGASKASGGIFSTPGSSGAVTKAVGSLKAPAVNIPEGFDITKTESYVPTKAETTAKYGTSQTISQAPKEGFWSKVGDFFNGAANAIFGESKADTTQRQTARNAIVQSTTDTYNNQAYVDIAKQLGIDQTVQPSLPKGIDPSKISPNVLQYYKEQAAGNAVKNNWAVIQKTFPDVKLPEQITPEQVNKALGVDPSSPLGKTEAVAGILGTAALTFGTGGLGDILEALTVGGIKAAAPTLISLGKNVALFTALDKATTPLREQIVKKGNIGDGGQALLYVAQQAANILGTHGASKGTDKVIDLFAKHTIEGFTLPQEVTLSGEDMQNILKTKGLTTDEFNQMADDLGWGEDQKNAIKNGATVTLPATKVITTADRPWWGKVKDFFGFEPSSETTVIKGEGGIEPSGGQIEGGAKPTSEDLMAIVKQIKTPVIATPKLGSAGEFSKIAARMRSPEKVSFAPSKESSAPKGIDVSSIELKDNSIFKNGEKVGRLITEPIKDGNIYIRQIDNQSGGQKGIGTQAVAKLFDNPNIQTISGDATKESLGFWEKMGATFSQPENIKGGIGSMFKIDKNDFYESQGLDKNGKRVETIEHGTTDLSAGNGNIREGSAGTRNDGGASSGSMESSFRRNSVEAAKRLSEHSGENGDRAQLLARLGQSLSTGRSTEINDDSIAILRDSGLPESLVRNLETAQKSGGIKYVSISPSIHGNKDYVSAYKANTIFLNPNQLDHSSYQDGSIINHEISGHSWYLKLDQASRKSFYENLKENKVSIKEAWQNSDNSHIGYWDRTLKEIYQKISFKSNEALATRITEDFGLVMDNTISLDSFIEESLNLDKTIAAVNTELARLGREAVDLEAHNTDAIQEHVAMLAEKSREVFGNTELMQNYLSDVNSGTLTYGPESISDLSAPKGVSLREKTTDIEQLRRMLDREQQSLNAAISNPEAHAQAYGENKIPIYQERIKDLKARIAEAKNPTFDTGNTLEDVRKTLEAVQKRTGVKPVVLPTMKVDGVDVPMPVDLYERELNAEFKAEAIKENPLNNLWKYANKKEGTLPEVTGKGNSKFSRKGDDIIGRQEFSERFGEADGKVDTEVIREKFADFVEEKRQFRAEMEDLKTERRAFIDKARADLAEKAEIKRKADRLGFAVPEYTEKSPLASISDLIGAEDALRVHPGRHFMKYVNSRTGILPEIDPEFPGVYGKEMKALLAKKKFTMEEAQNAVTNYIAHIDQLFLMTEDTFNPLEMSSSPSTFETNAFQAEKDRLAKDPNAKPLETMFEQEDKYPLAKKAGALDFIRTPDRVLKKMGLGDESELIKKKYNDYLKELPKNIQKITDWAARVPKPGASQRIFNYLNGTPGPGGFVEPDFLTGEEKKVGDEIKAWLKEWASRLHLKPHERLDNYITHIFEEDFIKKEFDQDLAKIIQDKVPGEVYDPFLQQRLGALGYVQDVFRALDAYVKRATRKVHMDVALQKVKVAAQQLDVDSYTYVKQYVDRINLRPTKTDNYIDNSIKQLLSLKALGGNAYRLGARPTARITRAGRQLVYRGTLGLNIGSALKNVSQGMNTFALLGPKYTAKGYMALLKGLNQAELTEENILSQDIIQDRTISSTKKFWEKFDSTLFYFFETAEKINRGAAYFGAKEKYYAENTRVDKATGVRLWQTDASEQKARAYAKRLVEQTQFTFGSVDTPLALGSDIAKTLFQFQSFNLKQAEFLAEMAKNKNYAGMLRYLLAGVVILMTLGKLFKMKWQDLVPFSRYGLPPLLSAPLAIGQAALGTADKYGNVPSAATREKNALFAATPFFPAGVQASKTIRGLQSTSTGAPVGKKIESAIFGPDSSADSKKIMTGISKSAAAAHTKLLGLNSDIASTGKTTWDQVKKLGVGSEAADALVSDLSDDEYTAYGYAKAADSDYWVQVGKTVAPIVDKAAKAGFGSEEADTITADLTDDQYASYKNIKNAVYGANSAGAGKWDQQSFVQHVSNLAKGWSTDPLTAFDDLIHGDWKINQTKNGQIIVERMPLTASEAVKKAAAKNNANYKLDHIIPLEVGGTNRADNLQIITTDDWSGNTEAENLLGKALGDNRITGKQAREYAIRFKAGQGEALSPDLMKEYTDKYGGKPMTFEDIQAAIK